MVADLICGIVVEKIRKLAERVCPELEPLLLLAPVSNGLFHICQPKVHLVVKFLDGVEGLVATLINDVAEVSDAEGSDAKAAKDSSGVEILKRNMALILLIEHHGPEFGAPEVVLIRCILGASNVIKYTILIYDIGCTESKQCRVLTNSGPC